MAVLTVDLAKFRSGDRKTFDRVYRHYSRLLKHFALSYVKNLETAEELVSDSMLKLWNSRERVLTNNQIRAFLYISTKNACIDYVRISKNQPVMADVDELELAHESPDTLNRIIQGELLQQIEDAVDTLPPSQQEVFRKSFYEGKTTEEISEETGMTASSIFSQKSKAVAALRELLKGNLFFLLWLIEHRLF